MANAIKILKKMRNNPRDWRIEDLKVLALHFGMVHRQHGTSHVIFGHTNAQRTVPVPVARPVKTPYIREFLKLVDELEGRQ